MKPATILLAAAIVPLTASFAFAQGDPDMQGPPVQPPERSGWTASLNIGPAEFHVIPDGDGDNQRTEGAGISLRVGKYLSPTSAVLLFVDTVDNESHSDLFGGAVQFHVDERWYARVGGGLGRVVLGDTGMDGGGNTYYGAGAVVALGREFLQLRDLALTGEASITGNRILDDGVDSTVINAAVHLGIVWF